MLDHVILTRFNLATPGREEEIRNRPGWLSRRFELFEKYCLPSIAAQEDKDFVWIIYFDKDTPQEFKDRIEELRKICPFVPYYTGLFPGDGWRTSVQDVLSEMGKKTSWLISTRLDNDDALANNYTARIRAAAQANGMAKAAFNITHGCILSETRVYDITHPSNAFFSLLEPYGDAMRTAPSIQHMTLAEHAPVVQIPGAPGWLQVVHGENVSNKTRGTRMHPKALQSLFFEGAVDQLPEPGQLDLMTENLVLEPVRRARDGLLAFRRKLISG